MNLSQKQSKCPWRRCRTVQNAHILRVCSAFSPIHALPWTLTLFLRQVHVICENDSPWTRWFKGIIKSG